MPGKSNEPVGDPVKVRERAYRLLAVRAHSRAELQQKLLQKRCVAGVVEQLLEQLVERGLVNDAETAQRWAESAVRDRNWGGAKIQWYLLRKGIAGDIIDEVLGRLWDEHREVDIAARAFQKRFGVGRKQPRKAQAAAFLKSRGFSSDIIYTLIRDLPDAEEVSG